MKKLAQGLGYMSDGNGVNLIGSPNGTLDVVSEAIRSFRITEPGSHTILSLTEEGPIMIAGPKTGGIVILELSEVEGNNGQYMAEEINNQNLGFEARDIRLPLDMVKKLNWQLVNNDKETPIPAYYHISSIDTDKRLRPHKYVQRPAIVGDIKHVPHLPRPQMMAYCDAIYEAYRAGAIKAGITSGKILMADFPISDVGLKSPTDFMPALVVHSILNWFPVVQATGYGFSALLIEDDSTMLGYRLASLGLKNPLFLRLAIVETTRTLVAGDIIDITPSIKKLRGWLSRNGYNTDRIDTLITDNYY